MSVSTLQPVPVKLTEIPDLDLQAAHIVRFPRPPDTTNLPPACAPACIAKFGKGSSRKYEFKWCLTVVAHVFVDRHCSRSRFMLAAYSQIDFACFKMQKETAPDEPGAARKFRVPAVTLVAGYVFGNSRRCRLR